MRNSYIYDLSLPPPCASASHNRSSIPASCPAYSAVFWIELEEEESSGEEESERPTASVSPLLALAARLGGRRGSASSSDSDAESEEEYDRDYRCKPRSASAARRGSGSDPESERARASPAPLLGSFRPSLTRSMPLPIPRPKAVRSLDSFF
eukprot:tig00000632_g2753.t1